MPINIALFGAAGRMGRAIIAEVKNFEDIVITHAYEQPEFSHLGITVEDILIEESPKEILDDTQVVVDYSQAEAVLRHAEMAAEANAACVIGVTGITEEDHAELRKIAKKIPLIWAPNMSPGMTMLFKLGSLLSKALPDYDRHITEIHHTQKKDMPSGSALLLQAAVSGEEKTPISALRLGDIAGEHRLILAGPGERIEIVHHAESRRVFALGTLRAVRWIILQKPGFYGMGQVLGL
jgi:4-hydroxy-tetrahydrodipicolinate reductase